MTQPQRGSDSHPNMFGAALIAGVLGALIIGLAGREMLTAGTTDAGSTLLGLVLLAASVCAYRTHRRLAGMSPAERDAYWQAFDRATEENHRRNVEFYVRRGRDGNGLG